MDRGESHPEAGADQPQDREPVRRLVGHDGPGPVLLARVEHRVVGPGAGAARGGDDTAQVPRLRLPALDVSHETSTMVDVHLGRCPARSVDLTIREMATPGNVEAFRALDERWTTEHLTLEDEDRRRLGGPVAAIVAPGGQALVAGSDGQVVGCVALRPAGDGVDELSKTAVSPRELALDP